MPLPLPTDAVAFYLFGAHWILISCLIAFALSGLDDLFMDMLFLIHAGRRRFVIRRKHPPLPPARLMEKPEQPIAIMLPAWDESQIIGRSLPAMIAALDYSACVIFVGVYPNDPATQAAVRAVCERHVGGTAPKIVMVTTPAPGPTCKADCLNWIVRGARAYESAHDVRFAAYVLQDAEDVVHPLSLRLFNWLLPRFDLIQVPVYSLARSWRHPVGGHYMDEFAEYHGREIPVRERFAGLVPGAGVGTCYSRRAIDLARETRAGKAGKGGDEIFSTDSLTEDYEFSLRMAQAGLRQIFAIFPVDGEPICTKEYFPDTLAAAVRQKARWTVGIACQGWRHFGWRGPWRLKYLLWRDRKSLFLAHFGMLAWLVALSQTLFALYGRLNGNAPAYAPLLPEGSRWLYLLRIALALLVWRLAQRHYWTARRYGPRQLPLVLPRFFVGGLVNYLAVLRALRLWIVHLATGKPIGWDKTAHSFPEEDTIKLQVSGIGPAGSEDA